jgi:uncharacterized protein
MKKVVCIFSLLLLLSSFVTISYADQQMGFNDHMPFTSDNNLLTFEEDTLLDEQIYTVVSRYDVFIHIKVVDSLGRKTAQRYADDYYDDYLMDQCAGNGILLLIAISSRDWAVTTNGETTRVITNNDIDSIMADVLPDLSTGNYYAAFSTFVKGVEYEYQTYSPSENTGDFTPLQILGISLLCGIVIGGIVILIMRSTMKSTRPQRSAVSYLQNGSYRLTQCADLYLYSRTTRTAKPKNNSSGSSGGGSRGGRSGKF